MPRLAKRIRHIPEYVLLRALEGVCRALPRGAALRLGAGVGWFLRTVVRFRRKVVRANMRHVGLWDEAEQRRIERRFYANMGRYFADFLHSDTEPPHDFDNMAVMDRALSRGKGVIVICAHFGNWEALAAIFGPRLDRLNVVAMPMHNGMVQQWLAAKRARTGAITIYQDQALRKIVRVLRGNRVVAVLIDQNARKQGTLVPFLGKPAYTVRTVAGLQRKTGCSVLYNYAVLRPDGSYHVVMYDSERLAASPQDEEAFIEAHQRRDNEEISSWIREQPDQWFGWFHRRWRGARRGSGECRVASPEP